MAAQVVDGGHDLDSALRRAARAQGVRVQSQPSVETLRAAIHDYRQLFRPQQLQRLQAQRRLALGAMQSFSGFQPRLVGPLIHGDGPLDGVRLLLIADTPEQVMMHLHDRHIPWRSAETALHYSGGRKVKRPALCFLAGDSTVELVILDHDSRSDPPRDPITGGPLEMLDEGQLDALIDRTAD